MSKNLVGLVGVKGAGKDTAAIVLIAENNYQRLSFATGIYQQVSDSYGVSIESLEHRDTKETPKLELSLQYCSNLEFIEVILTLQGFTTRAVKKAKKAIKSGRVHLLPARGIKKSLITPRSARWVLQHWGTEYRRESIYGFDTYWLSQVETVIRNNPHLNFVITDVRFQDEAAFIQLKGGVLIRVRREAIEAEENFNRKLNGTAAHKSELTMQGYPVNFEVVNEEDNFEVLANQMRNLVKSEFKS